MIDIKEKYNKLLVRYYNGCDYLQKHPEQWDKYYPVLEKILDEMNRILVLLKITDEEQILYGIKQ